MFERLSSCFCTEATSMLPKMIDHRDASRHLATPALSVIHHPMRDHDLQSPDRIPHQYIEVRHLYQ